VRRSPSTWVTSTSVKWTSWFRRGSTRIAPISYEPPSATQLDRHNDAVKKSVARHRLDLGLRHFGRKDLEAVEAAGAVLHIQVLGLASIADDVSPELALRTIGSIHVLGALHASPALKQALSDRIR
jgi:hypothetical protein